MRITQLGTRATHNEELALKWPGVPAVTALRRRKKCFVGRAATVDSSTQTCGEGKMCLQLFRRSYTAHVIPCFHMFRCGLRRFTSACRCCEQMLCIRAKSISWPAAAESSKSLGFLFLSSLFLHVKISTSQRLLTEGAIHAHNLHRPPVIKRADRMSARVPPSTRSLWLTRSAFLCSSL